MRGEGPGLAGGYPGGYAARAAHTRSASPAWLHRTVLKALPWIPRVLARLHRTNSFHGKKKKRKRRPVFKATPLTRECPALESGRITEVEFAMKKVTLNIVVIFGSQYHRIIATSDRVIFFVAVFLC